jgi:hypothetical protein
VRALILELLIAVQVYELSEPVASDALVDDSASVSGPPDEVADCKPSAPPERAPAPMPFEASRVVVETGGTSSATHFDFFQSFKRSRRDDEHGLRANVVFGVLPCRGLRALLISQITEMTG